MLPISELPLHSANTLLESFLSPTFKNLPTWISVPANSQWFGKHVLDAGIQGIVYPSVRNPDGFNIAVMTRNFSGSFCEARLVDRVPAVRVDRRAITHESFSFFEANDAGIVAAH